MDRLARFAAIKNYALYYGLGKEKELSQFDLVVVEPEGQSDAAVRGMQAMNTWVLAYLSVVEVHPAAPEIKLLLKNGDLLTTAGRLLTNREYGNYLADLRSSRWVGLLLHRISSLVTRSGYDGLFLDTIGDVESGNLAPELRDSLLMAAANVVRKIRDLYPGHILVQNCGLEELCLFTAEYLNGICWENPPFQEKTSEPWTRHVINQLDRLREKHGIKVLLMLEMMGGAGSDGGADFAGNYQLARKIADSKGFLLCRAPFRYVGEINPPEI